MAWILPALSLIAELGPGLLGTAFSLKQIFGGKERSPAEEELLKTQKYRMEHGLYPQERAQIRDIYAPQIARASGQAQSGLAAALASRGMSSSSAADMGIASILGQAAGTLPQIESQYDLQTRMGGAQGYQSLLGSLEERERASQEAGYSTLAGSLSSLFAGGADILGAVGEAQEKGGSWWRRMFQPELNIKDILDEESLFDYLLGNQNYQEMSPERERLLFPNWS